MTLIVIGRVYPPLENYWAIERPADTIAESRKHDDAVSSVEEKKNEDKEVRVEWRDKNLVEGGVEKQRRIFLPSDPQKLSS